MSHVSSTSSNSYPYRGTLSRLDQNDDGVLSIEEREADERPGILEVNGPNNGANSNNALSSLAAKLMQMPADSTAGKTSEANGDLDMLSPMAAYNSTYGQYDVDSLAA